VLSTQDGASRNVTSHEVAGGEGDPSMQDGAPRNVTSHEVAGGGGEPSTQHVASRLVTWRDAFDFWALERATELQVSRNSEIVVPVLLFTLLIPSRRECLHTRKAMQRPRNACL
jgi:hypothetical protein